MHFFSSLIRQKIQALSPAIRTTVVFSNSRTICCAASAINNGKVFGPNPNYLGHKNAQCGTKRTFSELVDLDQLKSQAGYCQPRKFGLLVNSHSGSRCYSTDEELLKDPDCVVDDLKVIVDDKKAYVIDVRRDEELAETGKIPGAVHIPLDVFEVALRLDDGEFKKQYGTRKPELDHDHIVINCRSGVRSLTALRIARSLGYQRSRHLPGGFLLWAEKFGESMISREK